MSLPLNYRRAPASMRPESLNREARTVEAVIATENFVARWGMKERLKISGANLGRLKGGPVLNAHRQNDAKDQLGIVENVRKESGALVATLRLFRGAAGDEILDRIEDGQRGISVGYTSDEWVDETDPQGVRVRTITKWTPAEVSLVPVPADPAAQIRSQQRSQQMDEDEIENPPAQAPSNGAQQPATPQLQTRAAVNAEIRSIADLSGLDRTWADSLIDRQASADEARSAAFQAMSQRTDANGGIRTQTLPNETSFDNPEFRARAIGEALFTRINPAHKPSEQARAFVGLSMPEIAREICRRNGIPVTALSTQQLITRALHTTSDFSLILGDTVNRTLRMAYDAAPSGVRQLARQTTARDFRAKHRLQLGEMSALEEVGEGGEYKRGSMAEAEETYTLATYGKIFGITRQAIINDDIGAFADLSRRLGQAARAFENNTLTTLLESNPTMSDTTALFHADHGNLAGTGAPPSETTLGAGRLAMRKQTGLGAAELISVTPKFVLVPAALETSTEKVLSAIQATKTSDVNPFASLSLLVEPRLTSATAWYVAADPAEIDGLEYAYLEGEPGPQIESRNGFDVDGVEIKVRLDFGAGFVEHRGWFKNAGA
ncbi:MAG TPA: HK97 family phage prohead protease [Parvularculaceae bacterium]|nr:HK97 family phage prohead protease [Amphiplicatus sp.]HPE29813.1 HK97 family phage prohead protease [Parvularculaceae bacterium]HRX40528.1 HK97 family phage prohead protease [Parvularculaceae bacterium]